jgi:histidyl-tRNA synthetase
VAIIAGSNEFQTGTYQIKDLATGGQQNVTLDPDAASLVAAVKKLLGIGD